MFVELKQPLFDEGFHTWTKNDFTRYTDALIEHGPNDVASIAAEIYGKTLDEVTRYHQVFMSRGRYELKNFHNFESEWKVKEKLREKWRQYVEAFHWKCGQYQDPINELAFDPTIGRGSPRKRSKQNVILLRLMAREGIDTPDVYNKIRDFIQ